MIRGEVTSLGGKGLAWVAFAGEVSTALYELRWMLVLMLVLIFADLWFGCSESNMRKCEAITKKERERHKFHLSRAGRKTINKAVDYITYLLIGCIVGFAITEPLGWADHITTSAIGVGFGCVFELASIIGHILAIHHVRLKIDWRKFIFAIIKIKSEELGDALDGSVEVKKEGKE